MVIKRTVKIKVNISKRDLQKTFDAYTKAYNFVCDIGFAQKDFNKVSLHNKTYKNVREYLPSQLAISSRDKAAESIKGSLKRNGGYPCSKQCSIRYDANSFNVWFDRNELSLLTVNGRKKVKFHLPEYFKQYVSWKRKSAELFVKKSKVFLNIVFEKDITETGISADPYIIGIDRGINKIAVCSNNKFFHTNHLKVKNRYHRIRAKLQKRGSKSAKRHLKRISLKENRYMADVNHCISKEIVKMMPNNSILVLEDLKNIRDNIKARRKQRRKIHSWSFRQLEEFLKYKAEIKGIKVDYVDARYTSQKCSACGFTSRSNRKSQPIFKCKHCGFSLNSDLNASRNIELNYRDAKRYPERLSVNQPIVANRHGLAASSPACLVSS